MEANDSYECAPIVHLAIICCDNIVDVGRLRATPRFKIGIMVLTKDANVQATHAAEPSSQWDKDAVFVDGGNFFAFIDLYTNLKDDALMTQIEKALSELVGGGVELVPHTSCGVVAK